MGCGHSKINIYPRKHRSKNANKKTGSQEKTESEDEESAVENKQENLGENLEDCDQTKTIKVKPFGGPLLAQAKISTSQQDFFRMLDEKIKNGPDYNSDSETEKAYEQARLDALLKDWETASAVSRSLPPTPFRRPPKYQEGRPKTEDYRMERQRIYGAEVERTYGQSLINQNVIEPTYGINQQLTYRSQTYHNQTYVPVEASSNQIYSSAMQYQALSPMYVNAQQQYQQRKYPSYNQHGSPIKYITNSSPKHIPYENPSVQQCSSHKMYGPPVGSQYVTYSNGEVMQYGQTLPQQVVQYQRQYKERESNQSYRVVQRNYQSSVSIPVVQNQQGDLGLQGGLHRKHYEMTW